MFRNLLLVVFCLTFTFCNAGKWKKQPTNLITCKNLTGSTDGTTPTPLATTFAPSQSPTAYFPRSYPGKIPSPCIKLRIRLQTENLLPVNINPDPVSNIAVIGKAIANITGGVINVPESPEFDDDDEDDYYDPNLVWELDEGCEIDNQITDTFLPHVEETLEGNMTMERHTKKICESASWWASSADRTPDCHVKDIGFTLTKSFQTPDSLGYKFHVDSVPLELSHHCKYDYLRVQAVIYQDEEAIAYSKSVRVYANEKPNHELEFEDTIILDSNTSYEIKYKLRDGYPPHCSFEDLSFGSAFDRRRLQDSGTVIAVDELLTTFGIANACEFGKNFAVSDEMKRGISAMCGDADTQEVIEEGLFRQHASNGALKNHLFKIGSLTVFDENEDESFEDDDFPRFNVQDPCVTVDEENRIVFAVGGRTASGSVVDRIQFYQFDDDTLTSGQFVTGFNSWRLDEARYASSCLYWKDDSDVRNLVVVSGMEDEGNEFLNRRNWYKDIRIFPIPSAGQTLPSFPIGSEKTLSKNMVDSKPMLLDNHDLYLFGGKTHRASKPYVSRFDLNDISDSNSHPVLQMELTEDIALPLIDKVFVDYGTESRCCYMIFGGQQYESGEVASDVNTTYLQLFCNDNMDDECDDNRRRLSENGLSVPQWTAFDLKHMHSNRRNLGSWSGSFDSGSFDSASFGSGSFDSDSSVDDSSGSDSSGSDSSHLWPTPQPTHAPHQVLIRDYDYWLDGVWYNFTVESEMCFEDNAELRDVVKHYELLIASKPYGDQWLDYADILSETLLNGSLASYRSWSDGFGAVRVLDLEIVDVNYDDTMAPTVDPTTARPTKSPTERPTRSPITPWPTPQWKKKWYSSSSDDEYKLCCECANRVSHHGGCRADDACEEVICDIDEDCCSDRWDAACATEAHAVCEDREMPTCCGKCANAKKDAGCESDPDCEAKLCDMDPFCCGDDDKGKGYWDKKCADKAWRICISDE